MTYDKKRDMERATFDAPGYRSRFRDSNLQWRLAQLELVIDELLDAIRPFAEAEIESETNGHFANARKAYAKHRRNRQ